MDKGQHIQTKLVQNIYTRIFWACQALIDPNFNCPYVHILQRYEEKNVDRIKCFFSCLVFLLNWSQKLVPKLIT